MTHRARNTAAALLAAGLLVLATFSGAALAHGGGPNQGGPGPWPHGSAQPTHQVKPVQSAKPKPSGHGYVLDCSKLPTASPSASATATTGVAALPNGARLTRGKIVDNWVFGFDKTVTPTCSVQALQAAADKKIAKLTESLQGLNGRVGKITALTSAEQATLTGEINGAIANLAALKAKIDAETTVAAIQTDLKTLATDSFYARSIGLQICLIAGAENLLSNATKLNAEAATLAAGIAAAPSGIDTASAQTYLNDMKSQLAAATALATPLPAELLALTPAQLQAGKADPTLAGVIKSYWQAAFDMWKARHDAGIVQWILAGKPGFMGHHAPVKSPASSPTSAPTATPV
ncbi:MAG: hypothetical protein ABSA21_09400 [Candidatus Limnocylindrales bacterium]|jgi:hypothetical protein